MMCGPLFKKNHSQLPTKLPYETMRDKEKREEELQFSPGKNVWRVIITGHPLWFILSNYP